MALLTILGGLLAAGVGLTGYFVAVVRNAEDLLPDHDAAPQAVPAEQVSNQPAAGA